MLWTDKDGFLEVIKDKSRYGIFLDMGVGKTALLLALCDYKFKTNNINKVLIITPKKVSLSTWQKEIAKWDNFNYMLPFVKLISGTPEKRSKILKESSDRFIHIISSSLTEWLYGTRVKTGRKIETVLNPDTPQYDIIIVDECSQFKDTKTRRYKALKKLATRQLFLLSGTPFSNIKLEKNKGGSYYKKADELYYILYLLKIYDGSLTSFRERFCFTVPWDAYNYRMIPENYNMLIDIIDDHCIRKKLELDIKKHEFKVYCRSDRDRIKSLTKDFFVETKELTEVTASNTAIMINKSLQVANGFIYDELKQPHRFNTYKFDKLKDVLKVISGNAIIFYNFAEDKDYILKNLEGAKLFQTVQDETDWNEGKIKYLVLSPFADKFGLNLQFGGSTVIWFGLVWSVENYKQAISRIYRTGQKNDVDVIYLLAEGTYDDYVYDTLVSKEKTIDDFISYVKEI